MKNIFSFFSVLLILSFTIAAFNGCDSKKDETSEPTAEEIKKMEQEFKAFADDLQAKLSGVYTKAALAYWDAAISGKEDDFNKAAEYEMQMTAMMSDKDDFKQLKEYKESGMIKDPIMQRELLYLYNGYLGNQIDTAKLNKMIKMQTEIGQKFQTYRAKVDNKEYTDNEIEDVLKTSTDLVMLEKVWEAHKEVGPVVADDIKALVKLRNEVAKELGFDNYHEMSLLLSDQNPADVEKLFNELDELTRASYALLKNEIDTYLANRLKIEKDQLMPWHYQNRYFQEAPIIYDVDLDEYYKDKDLVELTKDYYKSIGLPIEDMVEKSDLYEKPGKNQHAFCIDIDREKKDVRVLCNVKPNNKWMNTMLHEYGHAVYFKWQSKELPWILQTPAHIFTTEAIAMFFGRMASNPKWMKDVLGMSDEEVVKVAETAKKYLRLEQLVFSRWSQVMYRFEKNMYENPDQDLNQLWWDLVEKYQMVKKPEGRNMPDWATKTHIATSPCYYHNYHMGELLASQLYYYLAENKLQKNPDEVDCSFYDNPEIGKYMIDMIFDPGAKYYWDDMIEKATGEKLTAKYYAKQFVK